MRLRPICETLAVIGTIGLIFELAEAHTWTVIAAGAVAAVWLLARSH